MREIGAREASGWAALLVSLGMVACGSADGQSAEPASSTTAAEAFDPMADMEQAVAQVEQKLVALAEAMTEEQYAWRPMEGVRSAGEVFMHVAADNYFLTLPVGVEAPASTGITLDYGATVVPYETRSATRAEIIADLKASFAHLRAAMNESAAEPNREIDLFGRSSTVGGLWVATTTHMHEHLGQAIAYARANHVVPPWSG